MYEVKKKNEFSEEFVRKFFADLKDTSDFQDNFVFFAKQYKLKISDISS